MVNDLAGCGRVEKAWKPNEGAEAVLRDGSQHIQGIPTAAEDLGHILDVR